MASKICNIVNINLASIVIEIMMWITYTAFFGYMVCAETIYRSVPSLLIFSLLTLMVMAIAILELYGTAKKHIGTMIAANVIRWIKGFIINFLMWTIIKLFTSGLLYRIQLAFGIVFNFWDICKIILLAKIIQSMRKEDDSRITNSV